MSIDDSIRVCVIGNSLIGAVVKACKDDRTEGGFRFSFLGCVWHQIHQVGIKAGRLENLPFRSDGASLGVADYNAFVIYADMITPHEMVFAERSLRESGYSRDVEDAALSDMVAATGTHKLRQALRQHTDAPVYFLSGNVPLNVVPLGGREEYEHGVAMIRSLLDADAYIPFPAALFGEGFVPNSWFHKGSIDLWGSRIDAAADPYHDCTHLNELGGKMVLDQIVACLHQRSYANRSAR